VDLSKLIIVLFMDLFTEQMLMTSTVVIQVMLQLSIFMVKIMEKIRLVLRAQVEQVDATDHFAILS
jgi:hypothetical protein